MTDERKVLKDFTPKQDEALKKWMKTAKTCPFCQSDLIRFRGKIACKCGFTVIDLEHKEEPTGVM